MIQKTHSWVLTERPEISMSVRCLYTVKFIVALFTIANLQNDIVCGRWMNKENGVHTQ